MFANADATKKIAVEITLADGRSITGHVVLSQAADLLRTMNNEAKFLEFVEQGRSACYIAKTGILQMMPQVAAK